MCRTGAREMFLAILDTRISNDVLNTLYEANIQVTTTKKIKDKYYKDNHRVLTFEKLIEICLDNASHWENFNYTIEQNEQVYKLLEKQIGKHSQHKFVEEYYSDRLNNIKDNK